MFVTFILHSIKSNTEVSVSCDYCTESAVGEYGTEIWWKDENGCQHHATVKESVDEITRVMSDAIRKAKE